MCICDQRYRPDATEYQGSERADRKAGGKTQERENERRSGIDPGKYVFRDFGGQGSCEEEIVPFEHGSERGSKYDALLHVSRRHLNRLRAGEINHGGTH